MGGAAAHEFRAKHAAAQGSVTSFRVRVWSLAQSGVQRLHSEYSNEIWQHGEFSLYWMVGVFIPLHSQPGAASQISSRVFLSRFFSSFSAYDFSLHLGPNSVQGPNWYVTGGHVRL